MLKKINKYIYTSIVLSLLLAIIGLTFILMPSVSFKVITYLLAALFIVNGIVLFVIDHRSYSLFVDNFLYGIVSFIVGLLLLVYPGALLIIVPITVGMWFIVNGLFKVRASIYLKDESIPSFIASILLAIISIVCGAILIVRPIESAGAITVALGITLLVYSVADIIDMLLFKRYLSKIVKNIKNRFEQMKKLEDELF